MTVLTGYQHAIEASNKQAAATCSGRPFEAVASVEEQGNAYYVRFNKGFGRPTFISKSKMLEVKRCQDLAFWMQDFQKLGLNKIQIGTALGGLVRDFGELNYTNLELAIYEYRKGLKMQSDDDLVVIGQFDKWGNFRSVDSYYPQFEVK